MICKWGGRGTKNRKWRINSIWIGHFTEWNSGKCEHCRFTYPANILIIIIIIIIIIYCLVFRINSIRNYLPFDENVQNYRKSGPILSQFNENNIKVTIFPETYFVLFSLLLISLHKPYRILRSVCYCAPPCAVLLLCPSLCCVSCRINYSYKRSFVNTNTCTLSLVKIY